MPLYMAGKTKLCNNLKLYLRKLQLNNEGIIDKQIVMRRLRHKKTPKNWFALDTKI